MQYKFIVPHASQPKQAITLVLPSTTKPSNPCIFEGAEVQAIISDNSTHYASWHCVECDRSRWWIPKPRNLTTQQAENELIDNLLASGKLTNWEIGFCQSLKSLKKRSPRLKAKLQKIASKAEMGGFR